MSNNDENQTYSLSQMAIDNLNRTLKSEFGMTYDEFEKLDCDEQRKIIRACHNKKPKENDEYVNVMIGSGEHATFIKVKKGEKVMINGGIIIEAGKVPTIEEFEQRIDDAIDDIIYPKPVAAVKKLVRKIQNKIR